MWFPDRIKKIAKIDIEELLAVLVDLKEEDWVTNDAEKKLLAGDRPTNSLFVYSMDSDQLAELLARKTIEQSDVPVLGAHDKLIECLTPIFEQVQDYFPGGGVFLRVQIARMLPGSKINKHIDITKVLENSHRLHIPLKISKKLKFVVGDEPVTMEKGYLYELNNQVKHWVENPANGTERLHLIMDYMPQVYNVPESLAANFKFKIKGDRARKKKAEPRVNLMPPKVLVTSVVRGAHQSESHGGVYLVDMHADQVDQVLDWNTCDIDFSGRGWDRGLRGIAFHGGATIIAASDELFFYDNNFRQLASYKNQYLRHAHEIFLDGRFLYVTSTGFDAVLRFNLRKKEFDIGYKFYADENGRAACLEFSPGKQGEIQESNVFHINNAMFKNGSLYVSGRKLPTFMVLDAGKVHPVDAVPLGTHNVSLYGKGIIYNDTESDQVVYSSAYDYRTVDVPSYEMKDIKNLDFGDLQLARPGFGRGLCAYEKGTVVAGSSPSTVSWIDFRSCTVLKSINISMDVRNAVHGLEIWPY